MPWWPQSAPGALPARCCALPPRRHRRTGCGRCGNARCRERRRRSARASSRSCRACRSSVMTGSSGATTRSISLVEVLPTEPVTPTTRAIARARPARPRSSSAFGTSPTTSSGASAESPSGMRLTSAAAAPLAKAAATKSCPSRTSFNATNRSPGCKVRVSMETPVACQSTVDRPPVAAIASAEVQSAAIRSPHPAPRPRCWPVPHRQRDRHRP